MTERLYYYSDDLQGEAQVLACTPVEEGGYAIELNATLFHPQGGGQPADGGLLGTVPVLRVAQQGEKVLHFTAEPLPEGPVKRAGGWRTAPLAYPLAFCRASDWLVG